MELLNKLLLAPATLGLLAPMTAMAGEINFADVYGYSSSKQVKRISEFESHDKLIIKTERVEGLETKLNDFEASSFSETTYMSGSVSFQIGAVDENNITQAFTSTYYYDINLNTSFTGEDNLYVGIETGNSGAVAFNLDSSGGGADTLSITSMYYQFPIGKYDIAVGPLLDVDDLMPTTTSKYSDSFYFGGTSLLSTNFYVTQGTGAGIALARTFDNGINSFASIVGTGASSSSGFLTDEGIDVLTLSLGYDTENYGGGFIYAWSDSLCTVAGQFITSVCNDLGVGAVLDEGYTAFSLGGYWDINDNTTISATMNSFGAQADGFRIDELEDFQIGIDRKLGEGILSASWKTLPFYIVHDANENMISQDDMGSYLEVFYTYEINDSLVIKPGISYALPLTDENSFPNDDVGYYLFDQNIYGIEATFKF